tara:strand:- start:609 stop:1529 length:921 start_codon:yes stop_codon:yes gene_type:complete
MAAGGGSVRCASALVLMSILLLPVSSASYSHDLISTINHDSDAFTQGLEIQDGRMFESTGLYGKSQLREISIADGSLLRHVDLPPTVFGEGLTIIEDRILVLTWKSGIIMEFYRDNFTKIRDHELIGEGWGMCSFDDRVIVSNGTDRLAILDPSSLATIGNLEVRGLGNYVWDLNELECNGDIILANQWMTPFVHVISSSDGTLLSTMDFSDLPSGSSGDHNEVLNGLAWDKDRGGYWVTGKNWTKMHLVEIQVESNAANSITSAEGWNLSNLNYAEALFLFLLLTSLVTFIVGFPSTLSTNEEED